MNGVSTGIHYPVTSNRRHQIIETKSPEKLKLFCYFLSVFNTSSSNVSHFSLIFFSVKLSILPKSALRLWKLIKFKQFCSLKIYQALRNNQKWNWLDPALNGFAVLWKKWNKGKLYQAESHILRKKEYMWGGERMGVDREKTAPKEMVKAIVKNQNYHNLHNSNTKLICLSVTF